MWLVGCGPPSLASSNFEGDAEGWTLSGNNSSTGVKLNKTGGQPDGHICGRDNQELEIWYFLAPQKYRGDKRSAYGQRLIFALREETPFNQIRGRDVLISGNGIGLVWDLPSSPSSQWRAFSVRLDDASGWRLDDGTSGGALASEQDIKTALSNINSLSIRGEYYDGPNDSCCLDNVAFGTP
jgi:hypothetical protein